MTGKQPYFKAKIAALTLAFIGILLSWIPVINHVGLVIDIIAFASALFVLWLDRHGDKTLPIITALLSLLGIGLVSINQNYYGNSISHESKHLSVHINDKQADGFDWTRIDFDNLTVGDSKTGRGGDTYQDIRDMLGKPNEQKDDTDTSPTTRVATWHNDKNTKSVTLTFAKSASGNFKLTSKHAEGLN
ncbi:hypothetical protein ABNZ43_05135 [Weissella sp. GP1]|uniref:Uncharacterized protein n=1 Tax=Weissella fermenti TaxID=2987699 RepID=A0ABT6D5T2_9LACO|nr:MULTISPECIES: hypothetical protein [Weissella]MBJ7688977.1 hypothetical protein [Weissella confusa]MCW0926132.1 hypothetical protein [Weissella sp. LMG 11983]MDF9300319.1 hypothetical protein [Weissella sp. BK2]